MLRPLIVIDCETTGLGRNDRIVEFAAVELDPKTLKVIDEFDTLVNPERDVGPVGIHGVTASMVEAAPTFSEVAGLVARRLDDAVLVAHNLSFDARMLGQEFERVGAGFSVGSGICTLSATGEKLAVACERFRISHTAQHRALGDARVTAELLLRLASTRGRGGGGVRGGGRGGGGRGARGSRARPQLVFDVAPAQVDHSGLSASAHTLRRDAVDDSGTSDLARVVRKAPFGTSDEAEVQYLDMLDWVLDDMIITDAERAEMTAVAAELGLSEEQVRAAHASYLASIAEAAKRDKVITAAENELMTMVALALGVTQRA